MKWRVAYEKQSLNCRTPPQWLTPALLEAHLTEFVDQLEDRVVAELPAATWTFSYAQVFEAIPYDVWCDGWHNAAAAYLQQQIETVSIEDMPAVLAALDNSFPSKESDHE